MRSAFAIRFAEALYDCLRTRGVIQTWKRFVGNRYLEEAAQRRPSFLHVEDEQPRGIDRVADFLIVPLEDLDRERLVLEAVFERLSEYRLAGHLVLKPTHSGNALRQRTFH